MGFHKRFITKDSILLCKNFEDLDSLFNADALFLDSWLDVQLCIEFFRPIDIPQTISGKFDLMCNFCIHLIEGEFEK